MLANQLTSQMLLATPKSKTDCRLPSPAESRPLSSQETLLQMIENERNGQVIDRGIIKSITQVATDSDSKCIF